MSEVLLIGVGNEFRSDDALGPLAVREMHRRGLPGLRVAEMSGEGGALIEALRGTQVAIIIDAISSGEPPGFIHRIDASSERLPAHLFHASSHAFGVAHAIEMARSLGQLPRVTLLYGIEGLAFDPGVGLSDPVLRSMPDLLALVDADVRRLLPFRSTIRPGAMPGLPFGAH